MAGHSHWANIARKKALIDSKRGKVWTKLSKSITVAAKLGGGDVSANPRLRLAVEDARKSSMPKDNIDRAIKRGTGEISGGDLEEILYEGYGPSGVAVLCEILTDNRNRTAPEVRKLFEQAGGKLGGTGCVAWMFERKGLFLVPAAGVDENHLMEVALEAGADDVKQQGDNFEVTCPMENYALVTDALSAAKLNVEAAELNWVASNTVDLEVESGKAMLRLMERLDDHDDVQKVAANFNIPDAAMAEIQASEG